MGNSAASALREANGGSDAACSADVAGCSCGNGRAGRPAARRAGASAACPSCPLHPRPRTPRLSGSPLRKKLSGMTAATYVEPTVPAVAFAAQLVVGRLDRGPRDAPALRQAARGQARAGRQRALEHALADLAIDPGLLDSVARRVDGQVQAGFLAPGGRAAWMMWLACSWRRLACPFLLAGRQRRSAFWPGSGQDPVGKVACSD